ncbi:MAG: ribosome maturation factor RimP [Candidatus Latescibacteria bacterium]|nr:ribosome maturation factor RimP [Candidatus Latescibacterota bacterium]
MKRTGSPSRPLRRRGGRYTHDAFAQVVRQKPRTEACEKGASPRHIRESIDTAIRPVLDHEGIELIDVTWFQMGKRGLLRLYVDKQGGVTIGDCAAISSVIGDILDAENIVQDPYTLEVSSPGLERPLTSHADLERSLGRKVRIITKGGDTVVGRLVECMERIMIVDVEGRLVEIPIAGVVKARLELER